VRGPGVPRRKLWSTSRNEPKRPPYAGFRRGTPGPLLRHDKLPLGGHDKLGEDLLQMLGLLGRELKPVAVV